MNSESILAEARSAIETAGSRNADVLRTAGDASRRIPSSDWSVADAGAHLVVCGRMLTDIAGGEPSPIRSIRPADFASENARRLDELDEDDSFRLAGLLDDAVADLVKALGQRSAEDIVIFHQQIPAPVWITACCALGEQLLHGYDLAAGLGRPYAIDPVDARLVLTGYTQMLPVLVDPVAVEGLSGAVEIDIREGASFVARFTDGRLTIDDEGPADGRCSAEPVALLLSIAGRLSPWAAAAAGLFAGQGREADLAVRFPLLFAFP